MQLDTRMPPGVARIGDVVITGIGASRRDRVTEVADLTASECERRYLELARPLLELVVDFDRDGVVDTDDLLRAAVRIAGPCPAGWCRYPNGHTGDHEPLEAA